MADRIREAAVNAGPTPGNTKLNQVQDSMAELNQWSGRDYEGEIPTTGPSPVKVGPTTEEDRTDTIDELEESLDAGDDWEAEEVTLETRSGGNADAADGVTGDGRVWTKRGWVDRDGNPVLW